MDQMNHMKLKSYLRLSLFLLYTTVPLLMGATNNIAGGGGCGAEPVPATLVSLSISPTDQTILVNGSEQYGAIAHYSDESTADVTTLVAWASSDTDLVSIDASGLANASSEPTPAPVTITATLDSLSASTTLSVVDLAPAVTQVSPSVGPTAGGTSVTITGLNLSGASAVDFGGSPAATFTVNSDTSITATSPAGATGTVDILVTTPQGTSAANASDEFTYADVPTVTNVALNFGPTAGGTSVTITGTGFTGATSVQFGSFEATSFIVDSDTSISAITPPGTAGAVDVSVTNELSTGVDPEAFTYTDESLLSILVTPSIPELPLGYARQFTAMGLFTSFYLDLSQVAAWDSSSPTIASISDVGLATSLSAGSTQISAQVDSVIGATTLTSTDVILTSITVTPTNVSLPQTYTRHYSATGNFSDGSSLDLTDQVDWSSSDLSIASVSSEGLASALSAGATQITAQSGIISGSTTLTVSDATLVSITVLPVSVQLPHGYSQQLSAIGTFSDSSTLDLTDAVAWESSNQSVATVSASGLVSGVAAGSTQISVALNGVIGSTTLSVTNAILVSISISPSSPAVARGSTLQLSALGTFSDATSLDLTDQSIWSSSNLSIATASSTGLATGISGGSATIGARLGFVQGTVTLFVGN